LCKQLKKAYPKSNFVPVYWMASEDHDFEEISSFRFENKNIRLVQRACRELLGKCPLEDLKPTLDLFEQQLGSSANAEFLKDLIGRTYRASKSLSEATFRMVNFLFGEYGLVVIEPQTNKLKTLFKPVIREELTKNSSYKKVTSQIEQLIKEFDPNYSPQVNPREINLFYLTPKGRYRIERIQNRFI